MEIRAAVADDAEAIAALHRAVYPYLVRAPAHFRHSLSTRLPDERYGIHVAQSHGVLIGWAAAGPFTWTSEVGACFVDVYVHPEFRRQGIGSALVDMAHRHLDGVGARVIRASASEDGLEFAGRYGYEGSGQMHYAGLDPRVLPKQPCSPDGIELVSMNDLDPHQVYIGYSLTTRDVPGDSTFDAIGYDVWLRDVWQSPAFASGLSVAAVAGDEVAALTMASVDVDRLWTDMTGTVPAYRGRGLAKLVKAETLRRSAEAGVSAAFTANDELNQPMLTVNAWLGYRRLATHTGLPRTTVDVDQFS